MGSLLDVLAIDPPEQVRITTARGEVCVELRPLSSVDIGRLMGACPLPSAPRHKFKPDEQDFNDPAYVAALEEAVLRRRMAVVAAAVDHQTGKGKRWSDVNGSREAVAEYVDAACVELGKLNHGVLTELYKRVGDSAKVTTAGVENALKN